MVARINSGKSMIKALNYNEKKVQQNAATCLLAQNFLKEAKDLNFYEKLKTFEKLTTLNERVQTNTVHISLNFDPAEKLSDDKLIDISISYMAKIGFGDQPFLMYRHDDAAHPHIHILSTNIKPDGGRISLHNIGRNESERARKDIEKDFALLKAEDSQQKVLEPIESINIQKVRLGEQPTKAAISNVLRNVIPHYKYSSLAELNAILQLYNIRAERCDEHKHEGLLYRVLDEQGKPIGTPIKASRFAIKPTLKSLRQYFEKNKASKGLNATHVKAAIDVIFLMNPQVDLEKLATLLKKDSISIVIRKNNQGKIYGLTYVDHKSKTVFNGSDLGKEYSAKAMVEKCAPKKINPVNQPDESKQKAERLQTYTDVANKEETSKILHRHSMDYILLATKIMEILLSHNYSFEPVPYSLKKTKKKRRKKRLSL